VAILSAQNMVKTVWQTTLGRLQRPIMTSGLTAPMMCHAAHGFGASSS